MEAGQSAVEHRTDGHRELRHRHRVAENPAISSSVRDEE